MLDDATTSTETTTQNDDAPTSAIVVARKPITTLPELVDAFIEREAHDNDDLVLPLDTLRMSDSGNIVVPEHGEFAFTDWSRSQASSLLGLRWDRWFESASLVEQAEELNRRFKRASGSVKVRTSKVYDDDEHVEADGTLRALVSPSYSPIKDSAIARLLVDALGPHDDELRLGRLDVTDRTTSFTIKIGKPFRRGDAAEVGELWGGLLIRNSSVGFASIFGRPAPAASRVPQRPRAAAPERDDHEAPPPGHRLRGPSRADRRRARRSPWAPPSRCRRTRRLRRP
jgi:hypothetical protein